jgi:aminopeptidase N
MENAGCVTINDGYVFKEDVTLERKAYRAVTVIHELAHMWFGDLVTMKV